MWKSSVVSSVSPSFLVMPHSGRVPTVFTRINTWVPRALQSPTFELVEFLVGARMGPSFDSALLVHGQINYWIQMWIGVYILLVGFGIAKGQEWRSWWRFRCEVYEKPFIPQDLKKISEPTKSQRYNRDALIWHCSFDVIYWKGGSWDDWTACDQRR
jgi:hypothetical protein